MKETMYESMERKVAILRDAAARCMRKVENAITEKQADAMLDMALLWSHKADQLAWNIGHMTIGEAAQNV